MCTADIHYTPEILLLHQFDTKDSKNLEFHSLILTDSIGMCWNLEALINLNVSSRLTRKTVRRWTKGASSEQEELIVDKCNSCTPLIINMYIVLT